MFKKSITAAVLLMGAAFAQDDNKAPDWCNQVPKDVITPEECCKSPPESITMYKSENIEECGKVRFQWMKPKSCSKITHYTLEIQGAGGSWFTMPTWNGKHEVPRGMRHWDLDVGLLTSAPVGLALNSDITFRVRGHSKCGSGAWPTCADRGCAKVPKACGSAPPAKDTCHSCQLMALCCNSDDQASLNMCGCQSQNKVPAVAEPSSSSSESEDGPGIAVPSLPDLKNNCSCTKQETKKCESGVGMCTFNVCCACSDPCARKMQAVDGVAASGDGKVWVEVFPDNKAVCPGGVIAAPARDPRLPAAAPIIDLPDLDDSDLDGLFPEFWGVN